MEAIRLYKTIEKDGEILVTDLPYKKGQSVEIILRTEDKFAKGTLTAAQLLNSELIGIWKDRDDIEDSAVYARKLREQSQKRQN